MDGGKVDKISNGDLRGYVYDEKSCFYFYTNLVREIN